MARETAARVNITLPPDLFQTAKAYAEGRGVPFSTLIAELLRREVAHPADQDQTTRDIIKKALMDPEVLQVIKQAVTEDPEVSQHVKQSSTPGATRKTAGKLVPITSELRERVCRWSIKDLAAAGGFAHSIPSKIQRGQPSVRRGVYDRLIAALEFLERSHTTHD